MRKKSKNKSICILEDFERLGYIDPDVKDIASIEISRIEKEQNIQKDKLINQIGGTDVNTQGNNFFDSLSFAQKKHLYEFSF